MEVSLVIVDGVVKHVVADKLRALAISVILVVWLLKPMNLKRSNIMKSVCGFLRDFLEAMCFVAFFLALYATCALFVI